MTASLDKPSLVFTSTVEPTWRTQRESESRTWPTIKIPFINNYLSFISSLTTQVLLQVSLLPRQQWLTLQGAEGSSQTHHHHHHHHHQLTLSGPLTWSSCTTWDVLSPFRVTWRHNETKERDLLPDRRVISYRDRMGQDTWVLLDSWIWVYLLLINLIFPNIKRYNNRKSGQSQQFPTSGSFCPLSLWTNSWSTSAWNSLDRD